MKQIKLIKKLTLNKNTVSNLNDSELKALNGGASFHKYSETLCKSFCVVACD